MNPDNLEAVQRISKEYSYNVVGEEYEIDPEVVFEAAVRGVKELDDTYRASIGVIAYDVFSPSLMCLDQFGNPLYPCILYLDKRSRKQSQTVIDVFGREEFQNITGVLPFSGGVTITSLLWVKENLPDVYHRTYKFGHFNTYVCFKLTNDRYYLRTTLTKNQWQIFSINIGGFAIDWFRKEFYSELDKGYFYSEYLGKLVDAKFEEFFAGSSERFKAYLAGDRHSLEKRQGSFSGLTLGTTRDDMFFAVCLGIHEPILHSLEITKDFLNLNKQIIVTGGLSEGSYLHVKKKILKDYELKFQRRGTTVGNGKLALRGLSLKHV